MSLNNPRISNHSESRALVGTIIQATSPEQKNIFRKIYGSGLRLALLAHQSGEPASCTGRASSVQDGHLPKKPGC